MERHPRLGKLILAVSDEPQAERSWGKGAVGEEALGAKLNKLASERRVMLHDRRIPGSRANIDHIAVTPGGVLVIDAKRYSGAVEKRNVGGIFRSDIRLYVGRREYTKLLHGSEDQAEVVGAEWGMFSGPFMIGSVLITHPKGLYELLQKEAEVETAAIQETARHLSEILRRA
jgi:Nuclease-related domain